MRFSYKKENLLTIAPRWFNGDRKDRDQLCEELGVTYSSLQDAFYNHDVRKQDWEENPEFKAQNEVPITVELPKIKLYQYKDKTPRSDDEELAILHCSDGHAGKITKSFNDDVYRERMEKVFHATMLIVDLHRHMYPIRDLVILNCGDNCQGENPHQGSTIGNTSMGVRDQVKKIAAPTWNNVIGSLKEHFETVTFHGIPGNHGHDKLAPETSSYDLCLYDILEAGIGTYKGIEIKIHEEWEAIFDVYGHRIFMFHGDGIMCQQGVPFFALDKKLKSWHMQYGGFRYAFCLHPDSPVWRPDGSISLIKNLKVGAKIIGASGKTVIVKEISKSHFRGKMLGIGVRGLPYTTFMTPEHKVLKGRKWIRAGDVRLRDKLSFTPTQVKHKFANDDEWYKLLGTFLAEGYSDKYQTIFGFHEREDDFIAETQASLQKLYGKSGTIRHNKEKHSKTLIVCSKEIAYDLKKAGGLLDKKLEVKYMLAPVEKQELILMNWLRGNGHKKTYQGYTTSEILARQMLMVAWRLDYHATLSVVPEKPGHRKSFVVHIPMATEHKWRNHKGLCFTVNKIDSLVYDGPVFNLMVSHGSKVEPCYVVNGMKVHNSGHFHKAHYNEVSSVLEHFMTGSLVSDDEWALKKLGISSRPTQGLYGIHPHHGITWKYAIDMRNENPHPFGESDE